MKRLRKRLRCLLKKYDKRPLITSLLVILFGLIALAILTLTSVEIARHYGWNEDTFTLIVLLIFAPWLLPLFVILWIFPTLLIEMLWDVIGVSDLIGKETNSIRKSVGRFARETENTRLGD